MPTEAAAEGFNTRLFLLFVESRDKIEDYIHVSEFVILTNRTAADKITAIYHSLYNQRFFCICSSMDK